MTRDEFEIAFYQVLERSFKVSEIARRKGLLAVEDVLDSEKISNRDIFEYGMQFVIDGTDSEFVDKLLSNIIKQEKDEDKALLMLMQKEAVLTIQYGTNTRLLMLLLNSYTNIPLCASKMQEYLGDWDMENQL